MFATICNAHLHSTKGSIKGSKNIFFCQNLLKLVYNHKQKSNVQLRKKHKSPDRKGGVNPYGQPDRKISVFFLTTSVMNMVGFCRNAIAIKNDWPRSCRQLVLQPRMTPVNCALPHNTFRTCRWKPRRPLDQALSLVVVIKVMMRYLNCKVIWYYSW